MASSLVPQIFICRNLSGHVGPYSLTKFDTYLINLNFKQTLILRVQDVDPYME